MEVSKEDKQIIAKNIDKLFWLNGLHMFLILMPIIVPFFQSRGLSMKNIFELQSIFSLALLLLELPSGYISDLLGRKRALLVAIIASGIGYTIFPYSRGFVDLVVAELFLALGLSLFSGTDVSLLYDSLEVLPKKKAPIKVLGQLLFFRQMGEAMAALVTSVLILYSTELPPFVQMVVSWLPLFVVLTIKEPPRRLMEKKKHKENLSHIYRSLFGHSRLLTLIIFNGMVWGVATLVAVWTFQKYWSNIKITLSAFGYLWALTNFTVALTSRKAHKIEKRIGSSATLVLIGVFPVLGYWGMATVEVWWGFLFCLFFQFSRGLNGVILRDALNKRVGGELRATANSVMSLGTRLFFIFLGPAVGWAMDVKGLSLTFYLTGGVFFLLLFFLLWPLLGQRKNFDPIQLKRP